MSQSWQGCRCLGGVGVSRGIGMSGVHWGAGRGSEGQQRIKGCQGELGASRGVGVSRWCRRH